MRLLLDESLPRRLKAQFPDHEVATVTELGWAGLSNGRLLRQAEQEFDVFITADQNLEYQQHLAGFNLGIVVIAAYRTRIQDLEPLVPIIIEVLDSIGPGELRRVAL